MTDYRPLTLDVRKTGVQATINAKTGDIGTRGVCVSLVKDGESVDGFCSAVVRAKINGENLYKACEVDGNKIRFVFPSDFLVFGRQEFEIQVKDTSSGESRVLYSPKIAVLVEDTIYPDEEIEEEAEDRLSFLQQVTDGAVMATENANGAADDAREAANFANDSAERASDVADDLSEKAESGYFDGADGKDGVDGVDGKDGVSVTHSWKGSVLTVTSASGTSSADLKGPSGEPGAIFVQAYAGEDGYWLSYTFYEIKTAFDTGSGVYLHINDALLPIVSANDEQCDFQAVIGTKIVMASVYFNETVEYNEKPIQERDFPEGYTIHPINGQAKTVFDLGVSPCYEDGENKGKMKPSFKVDLYIRGLSVSSANQDVFGYAPAADERSNAFRVFHNSSANTFRAFFGSSTSQPNITNAGVSNGIKLTLHIHDNGTKCASYQNDVYFGVWNISAENIPTLCVLGTKYDASVSKGNAEVSRVTIHELVDYELVPTHDFYACYTENFEHVLYDKITGNVIHAL